MWGRHGLEQALVCGGLTPLVLPYSGSPPGSLGGLVIRCCRVQGTCNYAGFVYQGARTRIPLSLRQKGPTFFEKYFCRKLQQGFGECAGASCAHLGSLGFEAGLGHLILAPYSMMSVYRLDISLAFLCNSRACCPHLPKDLSYKGPHQRLPPTQSKKS